MGLPIGNIFLGTVAGIYVGRRSHYLRHGKESFLAFTKRAGVFTAVVTGLWSVSMGILALNEGIVVQVLQELLGIGAGTLTSYLGVVLVVLLSAFIAALQYWCTVAASKILYNLADARTT